MRLFLIFMLSASPLLPMKISDSKKSDIIQKNLPLTLERKTIYEVQGDTIEDFSTFRNRSLWVALEKKKKSSSFSSILIFKKGKDTPLKRLDTKRNFEKVVCSDNTTMALLENPVGDCFVHILDYNRQENVLIKRAVLRSYKYIHTMSWNPSGTFLALYDGDYCRIIETPEYAKDRGLSVDANLVDITLIKKHYHKGVAWSDDDKYLITGPEKNFYDSDQNTIALHYTSDCLLGNTENSEQVVNNKFNKTREIKTPFDTLPDSIQTNAHGHCAVSYGSSDIVFINVLTEKTSVLKGLNDDIKALAFDPTGIYLATGDREGNVFLWCTRTQAIMGHLCINRRIKSLAWRGQELIISTPQKREEKDILVGYTVRKIIQSDK